MTLPPRKTLFRRLLLILALLLCVFLVFVYLRVPSLDRSWDDDVNVLAGVEFLDNGSVLMSQVRDWRYKIDTVLATEYFDAVVDPDDITAMWMYEQPLDSSGLIAHTFVVFEFDVHDERRRYLGLSVETRREQGEEYSVVGGAFRQFEITHIWATERDLVTRRVLYLDYPLTRYKLEIPAEYRAQIFRQFVAETQSLASVPQWYNTAINNCTSSLIRYVNESEPGAIPIHYSYVLTGKVDEYLEVLGYKTSSDSLAVTREFLASQELR